MKHDGETMLRPKCRSVCPQVRMSRARVPPALEGVHLFAYNTACVDRARQESKRGQERHHGVRLCTRP